MSALALGSDAAVSGRLDDHGRLIAAEPRLAALHAAAGGEPGGPLAVPQVAALARLSRRLGIVISRGVLAADGDRDLDLWVRARPDEDGGVELAVSGWTARPLYVPTSSPQRDADFLRAAADWMWETDEQLRFTAVSPAAAAAAGRAPRELIGHQLTRLFRFVESEDGGLPILTALAEQRRFDDQQAELRATRRARYRLAGVPLIDGSGRFAGFRGSAARVVERIAPANDPFEPAPAAAGEAFGERLGSALRAPLDQIIAQAETIAGRSEGQLADDYAGYATDIAAAGRHLLSLVDDLVDLQAIEQKDFAPAAEPIDLADLARRAAGLLSVRAAERRIRIDLPDAEDRVMATGDFRRALQILVNLIANAVRFSPDDGMIWLRCEQEGDLACVIVADQGRGIAPDDHGRIFNKFERLDPTEPGGTGLGLYIARRLARAMGGDIAVDSAPGQGARFTLTLPVA